MVCKRWKDRGPNTHHPMLSTCLQINSIRAAFSLQVLTLKYTTEHAVQVQLCQTVLGLRHIKTNTKLVVYKDVVLLSVLHRAETWDIKFLETYRQRCL